jgi:hypothetical protein
MTTEAHEMNHRLQLSPISHSPGHPPAGFGQKKRNPFASWENARFFRSWLVYDSRLEESRAEGSINWSVIIGFLVMLAVSAGGWYGVSLLLRFLLR